MRLFLLNICLNHYRKHSKSEFNKLVFNHCKHVENVLLKGSQILISIMFLNAMCISTQYAMS